MSNLKGQNGGKLYSSLLSLCCMFWHSVANSLVPFSFVLVPLLLSSCKIKGRGRFPERQHKKTNKTKCRTFIIRRGKKNSTRSSADERVYSRLSSLTVGILAHDRRPTSPSVIIAVYVYNALYTQQQNTLLEKSQIFSFARFFMFGSQKSKRIIIIQTLSCILAVKNVRIHKYNSGPNPCTAANQIAAEERTMYSISTVYSM